MRKIIVALLTIGLLFVALPTIFSNIWVQNALIIPNLQKKLGGRVQAESMSFSWIQGQSIEGFTWLPSDRDERVMIESISISEGFLPLLTSLFRTYDITMKGIQIHTPKESVSLEGLIAHAKNQFEIQLEGTSKSGGTLKIKAAIPTQEIASTVGTAKLEKFPTAFLAHFFSKCDVSLAELIGPTLDLEVKVGDEKLAASVRSTQVEGNVSADLAGGVSFSKDSRLTYHMSPKLAEKLKKSGQLPYLTKPLQITFEKAQDLSFSFKTDVVGWGKMIQADDIRGRISPVVGGKGYSYSLRGNIGKGVIELTGNYNPLEKSGSVHFVGKEVSTGALQMNAWTGPAVDFDLHAISDGSNIRGEISAKGNRILLSKAQFTYSGDVLNVNEPFTVKVIPSLRRWDLADSDFILKVNHLSWKHPLECVNTFHLNTISFEGVLSSKQLDFANVPTLGSGMLSNVLIDIQADRLDRPNVDMIGRVENLQSPLVNGAFSGDQLNLKLESSWDLMAEEILTMLELRVEGDHIFSAIDLKSMKGPEAELSGQITVRLTEEILKKYHGVANPSLVLTNRAIAQLLIDKLTLNVQELMNSTAEGRLLVDELAVGSSTKGKPAALRKVSSSWIINKDRFIFAGEGITSNAAYANQGEVSVAFDIEHLLTDGRLVVSKWMTDGKLVADNVPSTLLGVFVPNLPVEEVLGANVSGSLLITSPQGGNPGKVEAIANSDNVHMRGNFFVIDGYVKKQDGPIVVDWKVTPDTFAALHCLGGRDNTSLHLTSPGKVAVELREFVMPLDQMLQTKLSAIASLENLEVQSGRDRDTVMIKSLNCALNLQQDSQAAFNVECQGYLQKTPSEGFVCKLSGRASNYEAGLSGLAIDISGEAKYAPPVLLGELLCLSDDVITQVDVLIGNRVDATIGASLRQLNGPVKVKVAGTEGNFSLDGKLTRGVLTLNQPFVMQLNMSPNLSDSILDELVPFLDSAVSSEKPVRFEIAPEGFAWGVYGDLKRDLHVESMTLDMGLIWFKNDQTIADLLSILKFRTDRDLIGVWFTPLYANFKEGVFHVRRMDMLVADRYPVAIWGKVDFPEDRVKMTVGLGGLTLKRAFGLKGVPNDYYLQVALKGTTSDPHLDVRGAATKLAAFIAQLRGGPQGVLMGGILDLIGGGLGQKKTPKPTTYPFPWDTRQRGVNYQ
jgi:hypothetical protein